LDAPENLHPQLVRAIAQLSRATRWAQVKDQWALTGIYLQRDPPGMCLCGRYPIQRHCIVVNSETRREVILGTCCLGNFLRIDGVHLFVALDRIIKNPDAALAEDLIHLALTQRVITIREGRFCLDMLKWRRPTLKQRAWRRDINLRIIRRMVKEG
jgi:hypothetical protein